MLSGRLSEADRSCSATALMLLFHANVARERFRAQLEPREREHDLDGMALLKCISIPWLACLSRVAKRCVRGNGA